MKIFSKLTTIIVAISLTLSSFSVLSANAAVTDEERKEITDELFETMWNSEFKYLYWQYTRSKVPIEDNPIAATTYFTLEAQVAVSNDKDIPSWENFDYEKAKKIDKYKNSLLAGYEFSYTDYQSGIWVFTNEIDSTIFYGYFREDSENFTLYDNDTNEVLGVYPRVLGFEYLNDDDDGGSAGGSAGGSGGNSGQNGTSSIKGQTATTASETPIDDSATTSERTANRPKPTSSANEAVGEYDSNGRNVNSRYDTDNPAVTPEIVSAVDEMKSSAATQAADTKVASNVTNNVNAPLPKNNNAIVIVVILAILAVGAAVFFVMKKQKGNSVQK